MRPNTIAIDGPAASGKSTVGRALAKRLGYATLDTGLLYRLVAREALGMGGDPSSEEDATAAAARAVRDLAIEGAGSERAVRCDGNLIEEMDLHTGSISEAVPYVSRCPTVRREVKAIQRKLIDSGFTIVAGRDIGTVVAPDADLKLYLDVSLPERAARRLWSGGHSQLTQHDIERALESRDRLDRERSISPMRVADDAVVVCTDRMSLDETIDAIMAMCDLADEQESRPPASNR